MKKQSFATELISFVLAASLLSGCATDAQRRAGAIVSSISGLKERTEQCKAQVNDNPEYQDVLKHISFDNHYTLEQLSDNSIPTAKEAKLLSKIREEMAQCKKDILNTVGNISPQMRERFETASADAEKINLALYQRKISWGDAARIKKTLIDNVSSGVRTDANALVNQLSMQHNVEIEQRKETAAKVAVGAAAVGGAALVGAAAIYGSSGRSSLSNDVQNLENENARLKSKADDAEYECRRVSRTPNRC